MTDRTPEDSTDRQQSNEAAYENLLVSIEASDGIFALFIAVCDDRAFREQIVQRYEQELGAQIPLFRLTLNRKEPSLRAAIAAWAESHPEAQQGRRAVLSVTGTEELLAVKVRADDAEQTEQEKFLGYLQWTREAIGHFPYPIILWVTSRILRLISRRALDFWSWRSGVFRFVSDEVPTLPREELPVLTPIFRHEADDDFPLPLEDLQDLITKTEAQQGGDSPMLATLYDRIAQAYVRRVERGEAADLQTERKLAVEYFRRAIELQVKLNSDSIRMHTLTQLGNFYEFQGRFSAAINCHQQALTLARYTNDQQGEADSLGNIGLAYRSLGQYDRAIKFHQQALNVNRQIGTSQGEATSLGNLGLVYYLLGQYVQAIEFYQQALNIERRIGDRQGESYSLGSLGLAYYSSGKFQRAIEFHCQALKIAKEVGNVQWQANCLGNLGLAYCYLKKYQRAIEFHHQHLNIARQIGDFQSEAVSLGNLGLTYFLLKKYEQAIEFYQQSLELEQQIGNKRGEADDWFQLALAWKELNRKFQAQTAYEKAHVLYQDMGLDQRVQECEEAIARLEQTTPDSSD